VNVDVKLFEFAHPDRAITPEVDRSGNVRSGSGGLVMARVGTNSAGVILPPTVRGWMTSTWRRSCQLEQDRYNTR